MHPISLWGHPTIRRSNVTLGLGFLPANSLLLGTLTGQFDNYGSAAATKPCSYALPDSSSPQLCGGTPLKHPSHPAQKWSLIHTCLSAGFGNGIGGLSLVNNFFYEKLLAQCEHTFRAWDDKGYHDESFTPEICTTLVYVNLLLKRQFSPEPLRWIISIKPVSPSLIPTPFLLPTHFSLFFSHPH